MNKFLAVLCLAAGVIADADPYYAAYGYAGVGGYAGAGRYTANSGGVVHVAKREAEAEADPYYAAYGYAGLSYAGAYGLGYAGAYGAYPYGLGYTAGYASVSNSAAVNINGLAPAALPAVAGGYAGAGRYVANSGGIVHVAKREAEADPYYAAYGYGLAGAHGLGYAGAYGAYPYGFGYAAIGGYANLGASGSVSIAGAAPAAVPAAPGLPAAAGRYCANSAGVIHCA